MKKKRKKRAVKGKRTMRVESNSESFVIPHDDVLQITVDMKRPKTVEVITAWGGTIEIRHAKKWNIPQLTFIKLRISPTKTVHLSERNIAYVVRQGKKITINMKLRSGKLLHIEKSFPDEEAREAVMSRVERAFNLR